MVGYCLSSVPVRQQILSASALRVMRRSDGMLDSSWMRTPNLFPEDSLRKTTKSIVNRNPKESNNPQFHRRPKLMENH